MDRTERFYRIDQLLSSKRVVTTSDLIDELDVSLATVKRDLLYMQNHLHAPILYDRELGGYRFNTNASLGPKYELPGLWFNESEVYALLVAKHLLEEIQPGILEPHLKPLIARLESLLGINDQAIEEIENRIRIKTPARRLVNQRIFEQCTTGLLKRKELKITHRSRYDEDVRIRHVSPQRLTYYKNTWYFDCWCHERQAVRSFSVDVIEHVELLTNSAKDVLTEDMDSILSSGYGIFSGNGVAWAKLKFSPYQAKWTSTETWHSDQKSYFEKDGSYILEIPYSADSELLMDILRYGPNVEVLEPLELRNKVIERLMLAVGKYT
jgi:predicted DNA-binding transcriptional regulator YafY